MRIKSTPSFRYLIRVSLAVQVVLIAILLGATAYSSRSIVDQSAVLERRSNDALLAGAIRNEFDRSRTALREFTASGDAFDLGPFSAARGQIERISADLSDGLNVETGGKLNVWLDALSDYLSVHGSRAVELVRAGNAEAARRLLVSGQTTKDLAAVSDADMAARDRLNDLRTEAENSVKNGQIVNISMIALAAFVILASSVGILLWIRKQMMLPLDDLAVAARKLGHGDLGARVEPRGVDEIAVAGGAFNRMADDVEQHVRELHEMSLTRSRFVSSVSHELRTPITSLRGYLEMVVAGEAGELSPDQKRYLEIAERNARQLDELINDLLTLSRIQSGRISLKPQPIDVRGLLRDLRVEMLPISSEKRIEIVLVDTGELFVSGDPLRLKQAFGNLVGNAIKYSPAGQSVVVRAFRVDRQVVVSVVDWGAGISQDDLSKIAEPFYRSSSTESIPGTGLGLTIAKQMLELHGGRLAVESALGSGSTFTAYLPLRADIPANADASEPIPGATGTAA